MNALELLKNDHRRVANLFARVQSTEDASSHARLFEEIQADLRAHSHIERKSQAAHLEEGYLERGVPEDEAEARAWATVNKIAGGGKKTGSGRGKTLNKAPARKGGRKGGAAAASR